MVSVRIIDKLRRQKLESVSLEVDFLSLIRQALNGSRLVNLNVQDLLLSKDTGLMCIQLT